MALSRARRSVFGLFLNTAWGVVVVFETGMESFSDWLLLGCCATCVMGCAYYVRSDIRQAPKEGERAA